MSFSYNVEANPPPYDGRITIFHLVVNFSLREMFCLTFILPPAVNSVTGTYEWSCSYCFKSEFPVNWTETCRRKHSWWVFYGIKNPTAFDQAAFSGFGKLGFSLKLLHQRIYMDFRVALPFFFFSSWDLSSLIPVENLDKRKEVTFKAAFPESNPITNNRAMLLYVWILLPADCASKGSFTVQSRYVSLKIEKVGKISMIRSLLGKQYAISFNQ